MYGKWGFRDSVNVDTGHVSDSYLSLDQGMVMAAIGNALGDDVLRRAFVTKATERAVRPVIGVEEFNSDPRGCTITGTRRRRPAARHVTRRRHLRPRRRRPDRRARRRRRRLRRRRPRPHRGRRRRRHALRRRGRRRARRRRRRRRAVRRPGRRPLQRRPGRRLHRAGLALSVTRRRPPAFHMARWERCTTPTRRCCSPATWRTSGASMTATSGRCWRSSSAGPSTRRWPPT